MGLLGGQFGLGGQPVTQTPAPTTPARVNLADPLGVDVWGFPDYDPLGTLVSGLTALCQRIARRLTNPRGVWAWAPNECTDVRAYLNESITNDRLASIKSDIERETLREEGVQTANADVTFNAAASTLTIHLTGTTASGPFNFVLAVTAVSLAILKAG
jgi:hypothetical protein